MLLPDLALVWAVLTTVSAAGSTLIYLLFIHDQAWAPDFIHLYASMGMMAGWLNALIYFLAPRSIFLQTRRAALLFYFAAIFAASQIYWQVFGQRLSFEKFVFLATGLIPVLYANAFGVEFFEGNYPWPYKRAVTLNVLLLFAAGAAFFFSGTERSLYFSAAPVGVLFLLFWALDRWNRIDAPKEKSRSIKPWLNPSLPILERTLMDQWLVARLDMTGWSFAIYALGRVVTFSGNIAYSYLMGTRSAAFSIGKRNQGVFFWMVILLAAPLAAAAIKYVWCAFLLGQIFAWLVTAQLSSNYGNDGRSYGKFLLIWLIDFALRLAGTLIAQDLKDYVPFLVFSSSAGVIAILIFRQKNSHRHSHK